MARCSFCSAVLELGTGKLYVEIDGRVLYFCSNKCEKNMLILGRNPRFVKWTKAYHVEKEIVKSGGKDKVKKAKEAEKEKAKAKK